MTANLAETSAARAQAAAGLQEPIPYRLFIEGRFVDAESGETLTSLNPHDNSPIVNVAMAGKADVDKAVAAAHAALPKWQKLGASERALSEAEEKARAAETRAAGFVGPESRLALAERAA